MAIKPAALHEALLEASAAASGERIETLLEAAPDRAERYRCGAAGLTLDFSKHLLNDDSWQLLLELANVVNSKLLKVTTVVTTRNKQIHTTILKV